MVDQIDEDSEYKSHQQPSELAPSQNAKKRWASHLRNEQKEDMARPKMSVTQQNFNAGSQKIPISPFSDNSEALTGFKGKPEDSMRISALENAVMPKLNSGASRSPENAGEAQKHYTSKDFNARRFKIRHVSLPRQRPGRMGATHF